MKYEFGVMSNKYTLESNDEDVAHLTMVMLIGNLHIPIAIFSPVEKCIVGKNILDMDNLELFIENNKEKLSKCSDSIKKIV